MNKDYYKTKSGDSGKIKHLGVMIDCSRNSIMNIASIKKFLPILAKAGYNTVQLYTEDTFEVNNEPYFGYMRGRYSKEELKEIDTVAAGFGMELIPCIQTLAHLKNIFRWPVYRQVNDCNDILLAGEERTYRLIENIFDTLAECFTSRNVNIGMDEAHMLGLGKYLDMHGYTKRADIMLSHLNRINEIANSRGFTCSMWSDMFYFMAFGGKNYTADNVTVPDEINDKIPKNIKLIYWDYYSTDKSVYENTIRSHQKLSDNIIFAGGAWSWVGLTPLNYYGIRTSEAAILACRENGIEEIFITMWGDNGGYCSPFSVLPVLIHVAEYAKGDFDLKSIKTRFKEVVGINYDSFTAIDLPNFLNEKQDKGIKYNPSKYLLYNDIFMGINDSTIKEGGGEIYKKHASQLKKLEKNGEYGFIFKTMRLLCDCLYYKADLGIRTRQLYAAGDKTGITELVKERYKPLLKKLSDFYDAMETYWHTLYKPFGFEITDIRLGGLMQRIKYASKKLTAFAEGKIDRIRELEEKQLDRVGGGDIFERKLIVDNNWANIVTPNTL